MAGAQGRSGHRRRAALLDFPLREKSSSPCKSPYGKEKTADGGFSFGRGTRARTLDTRFWRPLLYQLSYTPKWCMFDSAVRIYSESSHAGAGDGNRTRTASLEGWNSTIELHPQNQCLIIIAQPCAPVKFFLKFCVRECLGGFLRCALLPRRAEREFSRILYFLLTRRFCAAIMITDVL